MRRRVLFASGFALLPGLAVAEPASTSPRTQQLTPTRPPREDTPHRSTVRARPAGSGTQGRGLYEEPTVQPNRRPAGSRPQGQGLLTQDGTASGIVSPRDPASGQATGIVSPRDPASGQATGRR